MAPACADAL